MKFCKGDENLENEECNGPPLKVDNNQLQQSSKLILLQLHEKLPKKWMLTFLQSFGIWSKCWKVENLDKWVPHELTTNQKTGHFEASYSLILHNNNEPFLNWIVTCDEKWILYDNWRWPAQWWDWEEAAKHFPKPNLLPVWSTTVFWIPAKPLHLGSMLSKSLRCTKNCNTCSRHWPTERCQFFSMAMPGHTSHNQSFRSLTSWATKFCLICHIHLTSRQLNITSSSISTTFCRENASTTNRRQKMLSKSSSNPKAQLYTTGKNKLVSHWQKCVDCNGSYFD